MNGHIPWRKIDIWLQGYRSIWLSTTRPDDRPHCVPVWYWWQSDQPNIYIATPRTTVKAKNIVHQSWVILNAGNGDDTIILEGYAHPVHDEHEQTQINNFWQMKYVDPHSGAQATVLAEGDILYRIEIEHIMAWEYGAVSTRTDWHFDRS